MTCIAPEFVSITEPETEVGTARTGFRVGCLYGELARLSQYNSCTASWQNLHSTQVHMADCLRFDQSI